MLIYECSLPTMSYVPSLVPADHSLPKCTAKARSQSMKFSRNTEKCNNCRNDNKRCRPQNAAEENGESGRAAKPNNPPKCRACPNLCRFVPSESCCSPRADWTLRARTMPRVSTENFQKMFCANFSVCILCDVMYTQQHTAST